MNSKEKSDFAIALYRETQVANIVYNNYDEIVLFYMINNKICYCILSLYRKISKVI